MVKLEARPRDPFGSTQARSVVTYLEGEDVGAVVDLGGVVVVALAVARHKRNLLSGGGEVLLKSSEVVGFFMCV